MRCEALVTLSAAFPRSSAGRAPRPVPCPRFRSERRSRSAHGSGRVAPRRRSARSRRRGRCPRRHCTAGSTRPGPADDVPAVGGPHRLGHRVVGRSVERAGERLRHRLRVRWRPGRARERPPSVLDERILCCVAFMPGGTRRLIRARARGWMAADEPTTGGQSMPSTVAAGRAQTMSETRPSPSRSTPSRTLASVRNCSPG